MLRMQIENIKHEYITFMDGIELPEVKLTLIDSNALKRRLAWATVEYDPTKDKYELFVWDQLFNPAIGANYSYLLFHEFTHALDIAQYGAGDKDRYNAIRGYMEYHAAQVELARLLGWSRFAAYEPFAMDDVIAPIEKKMTVREYVKHGIKVTNDGVTRSLASPDIATIFHTVGTLYNHLGRLSICKMAAVDYDMRLENYESCCGATALFDDEAWEQICSNYQGIMTRKQVQASAKLYWTTLTDLLLALGV